MVGGVYQGDMPAQRAGEILQTAARFVVLPAEACASRHNNYFTAGAVHHDNYFRRHRRPVRLAAWSAAIAACGTGAAIINTATKAAARLGTARRRVA